MVMDMFIAFGKFHLVQWLFLVPVKGGRLYIPYAPIPSASGVGVGFRCLKTFSQGIWGSRVKSPNWQYIPLLYTTCSPCLLEGYMLPIGSEILSSTGPSEILSSIGSEILSCTGTK